MQLVKTSLSVPFELMDHLAEVSDWPGLLINKKFETLPLSQETKQWFAKQLNDFEYEQERNLLFHIESDKKFKFVPFKNRADLVQKCHVGQGHQVWKGVYARLKGEFWWPGLKKDIEEWCKGCQDCQLHQRDDLTMKVPMQVMETDLAPLSRWGIDFIGPLPPTEKGNKWIIVAIDHVTRWPVAKAMAEATAENVAQFIYSDIMV